MALPKKKTAHEILKTFKVSAGIFAIGVRERGVTLYNQQVRAHNLIWALVEQDNNGIRKLGRVAIIGGGAAGLTATAALLACTSDTSVTLFEKEWDLCPVQQGCDGRWLHPSLYAWPGWGSRAPSASLPILDWSEGRASDVARTLLDGFSRHCQVSARDRFQALVGVHHLQVQAARREIRFIGTNVVMNGPYFTQGESEGRTDTFDTIIFAAGFGWERTNQFNTNSYWRNEQLGQPNLTVDRSRYLVSGSGDGALVDVCRLTIERFRQDTILYELFGTCLEETEEQLRIDLSSRAKESLLPYFEKIEETLLREPKNSLRHRLRKDTAVTLHIAGKDPDKPNDLEDVFGPTSSVLNRVLIYLLYRCGAISISRRPLDEAISSAQISADHVLCRHGCDTERHLKLIFNDYSHVEKSFSKMGSSQAQHPERYWRPGYFPVC
ncbi:hypothetical protein ASG25_10145 [Rhizobium sp. Leaf384]|uniref:NAD(P)-binding protein n=1 Tax=unclassified Rhizobium TaxID=2613769 RepID=UPI000714C3F1|nr:MULTISPECIES: NAD(P)-binding protein [unclassified Rhizobium]KQS78951.1 hypothetical protein ASG25_10145 [Rhizobium sp. Leaf384]KQS82588.1 hypothetical protein ASG58_04345 [Rhizobium sp. Leaf383]